MRLTKKEIEAIFAFGENRYLPHFTSDQKRWYYNNKTALKGILVTGLKNITTSCYDGEHDVIMLDREDCSGKQSARILWTVLWHEYGHHLYEKCLKNKNDIFNTLEEEIKNLTFEVVVKSDNVLVMDAYAIINQKYLGTHREGYGASNPFFYASTEAVAIYLSYIMTNKEFAIETFSRLCPKTSRVFNKVINGLFK